MTIPTYKMIDYTYNDGGRANAGYRGTTGDCLPRAAAIISGKPYKEVYKSVAAYFKKHKYAATGNAYAVGKKKKGQKNGKQVQLDWLASFGFEKVKLPKGKRPTYTEAYELYGDCLVTTRRHFAAIKDGMLHDIYDGRTYEFMDDPDFLGGEPETRERKAMSVFIYKGVAQ